MSTHPFTSSGSHGLLKSDNTVRRSLNHEMHGHMSPEKVNRFADSFKKALEDRSGTVGHQITREEVADTVEYMKKHIQYRHNMTRKEIDDLGNALTNDHNT